MFQRARQLHYIAVLIAQIFLLFVAAVMEHHIILTALFIVALLGIFGTMISTIWGSSLPRTLSLAAAAIAIASGLLALVPGVQPNAARILMVICCFSYAAFIFIAYISIVSHVFVTDRVTANRIIGSICVYMLLGMFFAFVFAAMGLISSSMFDMSNAGETASMVSLRDFIYFSYSTLTTTGFGDMIPTQPISRMVTSIEEVAGSVYLAIMVARLVGMHVSQAHPHPHPHES
jgi:voltage-gated potassium channel